MPKTRGEWLVYSRGGFDFSLNSIYYFEHQLAACRGDAKVFGSLIDSIAKEIIAQRKSEIGPTLREKIMQAALKQSEKPGFEQYNHEKLENEMDVSASRIPYQLHVLKNEGKIPATVRRGVDAKMKKPASAVEERKLAAEKRKRDAEFREKLEALVRISVKDNLKVSAREITAFILYRYHGISPEVIGESDYFSVTGAGVRFMIKKAEKALKATKQT